MQINLDRAKAGNFLDFVETVWAAHKAGESWGDALSDTFADRLIKRYQKHIAAALRKVGFDIADDGVLDGDTLRNLINDRAGLNIEAWSGSALVGEVDALSRRELGAELGLDWPDGAGVDAITQLMSEKAVEAVQSGRANGFISAALVRKVRAEKAWAAGGVTVTTERQKILNRSYQKRYRHGHKEVWTNG